MIGNKEDRDASRPESEVTTNGIIRMDRLFQAFPPQSKEPHVQVSSHTAQMTNGKSRPLAGPKLLVPAFPGLNEISATHLGVRRNSVSLVSGMKPGEMALRPALFRSLAGPASGPRITFVALLLAVIHPKHESVIITYEWSFRVSSLMIRVSTGPPTRKVRSAIH